MDTTNLNNQIQAIENNIENCKAEMEDACNEFLKSTEEFISDWYKNITKSGLTANAGNAMELGVDGLRIIKNELNKLLSMLPELVEKHVNTSKWPHRGKLPDDSSRKFGISIVKSFCNEHLHNHVEALFGYIGALLIKYRLADNNWNMGSGDELPVYRVAWIWPESMDTPLRKYADGCDKWINLNNDLKKLVQKKTEMEITELWDKL